MTTPTPDPGDEVIINNPKPPFLTQERRALIYRVILIALFAAQAFRWIDAEDADTIANALSIVLGISATGLATLNTTTRAA